MKKDPYLVQRLCSPFGENTEIKPCKQLDLSVFDRVFRLDYMGHAEYEFGTVGKSIRRMNKELSLEAFSITVKGCHIKKNGWDRNTIKHLGYKKKLPFYPEDATIYILCDKGNRTNVEKTVRGLISEDIRPKNGTQVESVLDHVLSTVPKKYRGRRGHQEARKSNVCGWFDLENDFMYFSDELVWKNVCHAFNVLT